ncbi:hypothetical protein ET495_15490 [Xylanimonas allomyrinae]|uniref:Histidine kinase/HSP90-like ATPase domain-containing protein n=1 Tax=Xylanimonas allomyrinae TaxID=2509459 RepID=A0A4P6ENC3_9MICO|nr:histidine kinase [Xylanimonas allomyrinae]QAY64380.1 hypothetical protein ET495_15490 [Xylanimonas allomyrinae]
MSAVISEGERDEFTRRLIGICMLVRLVAILVAFAGLAGQILTPALLLCALVQSVTGLALLMSARVGAFVANHPLAFVADVLISLGVVAVLGTESPLVLATMSTAIVTGFLFTRPVAATCAVVLVAGHLLVSALRYPVGAGFMTTIGVPAIYVGLVAIGGASRHAHAAQVESGRDAAAALLAAAAADERARLAREMHDSLGKTLHGVALGADALPQLVENDPAAARDYAADLARGAGRAAREARQILVRLRADQPDRPLADVLRGRCDAWQEETGVPCTLHVDGAVDLPTDARYEVLAIVAEAMENARRHAEPRSVVVRLAGAAGGAVEISVTDDGKGFVPDPDGRSPYGRFGLTGMAERAAEAGISLVIRSAPAQGTTVAVRSPAVHLGDAVVRTPDE